MLYTSKKACLFVSTSFVGDIRRPQAKHGKYYLYVILYFCSMHYNQVWCCVRDCNDTCILEKYEHFNKMIKIFVTCIYKNRNVYAKTFMITEYCHTFYNIELFIEKWLAHISLSPNFQCIDAYAIYINISLVLSIWR